MTNIDHVVLYASNAQATIRFYGEVLGFAIAGVPEWRRGERPTFRIQVGADSFINVHPEGSELHPRAARATPGGLDVCMLSSKPVDEVIAQLERAGVPVEFGPAERTTALGARSVSVYIRDPDGNLLEFMCPRDEN